MSQYPLNACCTKKSKQQPAPTPPQQMVSPLRPPADYSSILKGERIFIEVYSRGRVVETEYGRWVEAMGGSLQRRLNANVRVFLTNLQRGETSSLMERLRKMGGECRLVSILWLQECFRKRRRVDTEGFEIVQETMQETQIENWSNLNAFLVDISEDVQYQLKQSLKKEGKRFFQYLPKEHSCPIFRLMSIRQMEKGRAEEKRRSRKRSRVTESSQGSEVGSEATTEWRSVEKGEVAVEEAVEREVSVSHRMSLENLMEKYLGKDGKMEPEQTVTVRAALPSRQSPLDCFQVKREPTQQQANQSQKYQSQKQDVSQVKNQPKTVVTNKKAPKSRRIVSSHVNKRDPTPINDQETLTILTPSQNHAIISKLLNQTPQNTLLVLTTSPFTQARINKVNQSSNHPHCITITIIPYLSYLAFLSDQCVPHRCFFLIDQYKIADRLSYYALTLASPYHPVLVSTRILDEILAINYRIKAGSIYPPKLDAKHYVHLNPVKLQVNRNLIKGKNVAVLQSEIKQSVWQLVVESLGGVWMSQQDYQRGEHADVVVSNRWSMQEDRKREVYLESELLARVLELEE